jgi:PDDEXK-like domain of unknown function (DUF3799)
MPELIHHEGLSNEDYHRLKAVSPSRLSWLAKSPLHYYDQFLAEDRESPKPTPAMLKGTALHTAILEPNLWDSIIAVPPHSFDRRTKVGKELADEFERESAGKIVLSPDDADEVRRMADAVRKHPAAGFLLELPGRREASYSWSDEATGLECKTRPDWHSEDRRIVVDIKTTKDASRVEFAKSIANFDYHVQAAWNLTALEAEQFLTIAVENQRPYAVAVYPASGALIAAGMRRIEAAMTLLAECYAQGRWPGYGDFVQEPIELPGWCRD